MKRRIVALLAAAILAAPLAAQNAAPVRLTMEEAVRRALAEGEEVGLARVQVQQARGQVIQARADALPQVRAGLTYQRTFYSPFQGGGPGGPGLPPFSPDTTQPLDVRIRYLEQEYPNVLERQIGQLFSATPFGRPNTYTGTLSLTQTLFQGGKLGAGLRGARAYERAAERSLDEARADIAYRTRTAYLAALFADRLLQISQGARELSAEQLRRVELNHRVGSSADYDLLRARVELANQEPMVLEARTTRDIAFLQLRQLVNIPADQPIELETEIIAAGTSVPEVDFDRLGADLAGRAAIAAAEANVQVQEQAVRYYQGEYWPALKLTVNLGAQLYPNGVAPSGTWRRDWNASLGLSWQLFDGMRTRGQIAAARADLAQARLSLAQTREAASLDVERARGELVRSRSLLDARQQTVAWASRAQHLASVRFANGIATPLEVSDARQALRQAQVNEAAATRDYLLALAAMERAMGRPVPTRPVQMRAGGIGEGW